MNKFLSYKPFIFLKVSHETDASFKSITIDSIMRCWNVSEAWENIPTLILGQGKIASSPCNKGR